MRKGELMKLPVQKPKIAILSIRNTYDYGGVLTSLKIIYKFCSIYFEPTVFFLGFDKEIAASLRSFKFVSTTKPLTYFGMNCIEIGARWAFWEPGHYKFTDAEWKKQLEGFDYFFAVSGTCIAAHPLIQLDKNFAMWVSTPYDDDRSERVKKLTGIYSFLDKIASPFMHKIEKKVLARSTFIFALSNYSKVQFERILGKPRQNMVLCGFPMDPKIKEQRTPPTEHVIIAVGRFSDPRKNIDMLMRAFERIFAALPGSKLYVVGQKPSDEKLRSCAQQYKSFKNITFTGQVSQADLNNLYRNASLMLITSHQEGLGIVGLEALSHGIPIVATNCGGPRDYVIENHTGYLASIDNDTCMAQKAIKILKNPELHAKMMRNATQFIAENLATEKIHAIFKQGLTTTYPSLESWFKACDLQMNSKIQAAQKDSGQQTYSQSHSKKVASPEQGI